MLYLSNTQQTVASFCFLIHCREGYEETEEGMGAAQTLMHAYIYKPTQTRSSSASLTTVVGGVV